ncbi:MAG: glucose-1-phosphate adenylyltransferase, partial [Tissierellaceae bacterium]
HYVARGSLIINSLVNEGCYIMGEIKNSILFSDITVEEGAKVNKSVIHPGVTIKAGAQVNNAVITERVVIGPGEKIGSEDDGKIYLVTEDGIMVE